MSAVVFDKQRVQPSVIIAQIQQTDSVIVGKQKGNQTVGIGILYHKGAVRYGAALPGELAGSGTGMRSAGHGTYFSPLRKMFKEAPNQAALP